MFRYDEPQAGRQREFWQAGIELVGSGLPEADAEAIALMIQALQNIGLKDVRVDVGQVGIFKELVKQVGLNPETIDQIRTSIDKKDRQTLEKALEGSSIDEDTKKILRLLPELRGGTEVLERLSELIRCPEISQIVENLKKTLDCLKSYAVPEGAVTIDLGIIRGIDYYTGVVFEAYVPELGMAIGGGGRYDGLIREFSSSDVPATGFAIGVDRCMLALEKQVYPFPSIARSTALILPVTEKMREEANKIANLLRRSGISTETDISGWNLSRGLSYGSRANIPYVIVLGEEEYERGTVVVRDMKAGKQTEVKIDELPAFLRGEKT
jgi:histidyl-tRNA synthetase